MQTVKTLIRRRVRRLLIWVYMVCQRPFFGTLDLNGLMNLINSEDTNNTSLGLSRKDQSRGPQSFQDNE